MKLRHGWRILTHLGPRWVIFRAHWAWQKRTGALRRKSPAAAWAAIDDATAAGEDERLFREWPEIGEDAIREAEEVMAGTFRLFSVHRMRGDGVPDWHRNQISGERVPCERHWSELGDFAFGDIKAVWELNRFPWAFALARAYARTRDDRYAERFWHLFEAWMRDNPPNCGANWMCGQEATFRLMAVVFAVDVFRGSPASTAERERQFRRFVRATGRRIDAHLDYALSQSNNHGVSECCGLITAELVAGEGGDGWRARGLAQLEKQVRELVYEDGSFAQHSAVYHRVLLHDLIWATAILRAKQQTVPEWLLAAGRRAVKFIADLINPATGAVPLYGANDGANILPLAEADYLDFRPVVQAGAAVFFGERWLPVGPWDEAAIWLAGKQLPAAVTSRWWRPENHWKVGGLMQLRNGDSRLVMRCPEQFRHRPSQTDLLHVDFEWRGIFIAHDVGSYSYNAKGAFHGALKEARVHNTITFGGEEPMTKVSRFLYLPWPAGRVSEDVHEATHNGWRAKGCEHRRRVAPISGEGFKVIDSISCRRRERVRLHWLLADWPHEFQPEASRVVLITPSGRQGVTWTAPVGAVATLVRADEGSNRGWWSPHYLEVKPALSLAVEFDLRGEATVETRFEAL